LGRSERRTHCVKKENRLLFCVVDFFFFFFFFFCQISRIHFDEQNFVSRRSESDQISRFRFFAVSVDFEFREPLFQGAARQNGLVSERSIVLCLFLISFDWSMSVCCDVISFDSSEDSIEFQDCLKIALQRFWEGC
jgi:hypothetical protein